MLSESVGKIISTELMSCRVELNIELGRLSCVFCDPTDSEDYWLFKTTPEFICAYASEQPSDRLDPHMVGSWFGSLLLELRTFWYEEQNGTLSRKPTAVEKEQIKKFSFACKVAEERMKIDGGLPITPKQLALLSETSVDMVKDRCKYKELSQVNYDMNNQIIHPGSAFTYLIENGVEPFSSSYDAEDYYDEVTRDSDELITEWLNIFDENVAWSLAADSLDKGASFLSIR